jgi:hypothetical protein
MLEQIIQKKTASRNGFFMFIATGCIAGCAISLGLMEFGRMRAKLGRTFTPEWREAEVEYRKFHRIDPITNRYD